MEFPPTTIYIVYYKTIQGEWRPSFSTPYKENAIKLTKCYETTRLVEYHMERLIPHSKKVRKVRKVVD